MAPTLTCSSAPADILPTRANLLRRKVHIDPLCTLCGQHDETTGHILQECPLARSTWALVRGKIQKSNSEAPCFYLLARQMLDRLPKKEMETQAMTAWSLWTARNKFHFEQVQTPPTMIFRRASSLLDKYQQLMAALPS